MYIEIDAGSGFCVGVVRAITIAEKQLAERSALFCLGDIVHNGQEVNRLEKLGLQTINHDQLLTLSNSRVMFRAHGEPPSTYATAQGNGNTIIDATCPVVLQLQRKIAQTYHAHPELQIVIFGKVGHAEVIGLQGQTDGKAIVVESTDDIAKIDPSKGVALFSQTTKSVEEFNSLAAHIKAFLHVGVEFKSHDTICRQVSNRISEIKRFAQRFDAVFFVSGAKSSNGKVLFAECQSVNSHTYFITSPDEIDKKLLIGISSIGICGATSTPKWLMEAVEQKIKLLNSNL